MPDHHLHIHSAGDPKNPPVVLLHGFLGTGADWREVMDALSDRFYCLAPDLPGHGETVIDGPDTLYTANATARLLAGYINGERLQAPDLIGYSMGGRLALYLTINYPDYFRRMVLESGSPGLNDPAERAARREQDLSLASRLESEHFEKFLEDWYNQPIFASLHRYPDRLKALIAHRLKQSPLKLAVSLRHFGTGAQEPLWNRLAKTPPTLLIVGEQDAKFRQIAGRMAPSMPDAVVAIVPDAGHNVHFEQPERFTEAVREFLRR